MKKPLKPFVAAGRQTAAILFVIFAALCRDAATPFYWQAYNQDGTPQTNTVYMTQYPPSRSPFTVYGTNVIYGGQTIVITPNASGYASNWCYPGPKQLYITNLNVYLLVNVPDTTSFQSLSIYMTNAPAFSGVAQNSFGLMSTLLGFNPATNSNAGIVFALGYAPATNTFNGITNSLGFWPATNTTAGISAALGYVPATNTYLGISNLLAFVPATNSPSGIANALNYMPATNNNAGVVFALGFAPATNNYPGIVAALGYAPAVNNNAGIVAALGFAPATNATAGIEAALGYTPATNTYSGLTNALGLAPATNSVSGIESALGFTPAAATFFGITTALGYAARTNDGYTGLSALSGAANIVTNGFVSWVSYKTNDLPGAAFTNLPNGSLMSTTNGQFFVLSNLTWNLK